MWVIVGLRVSFRFGVFVVVGMQCARFSGGLFSCLLRARAGFAGIGVGWLMWLVFCGLLDGLEGVRFRVCNAYCVWFGCVELLIQQVGVSVGCFCGFMGCWFAYAWVTVCF